MKKLRYKAAMFSSALLGVSASFPSIAQTNALRIEEVMVTARRMEERLQDVPISMTVLSSERLTNANITNASDLATYTPSLHSNNRSGPDTSSFSIRGFSQELRTTASVGVYFAEVVAPRGANATLSGDGAGPGDFFDLENVQVLKGPQGTLFGRNTTGGAVLLTPVKPGEEFGGYAEVSLGNYDMVRTQAVINAPLHENFRLRFGIDSQKKDGFLKNTTGIGPDDFSDVDYDALRLSAVWDITDNLENYTIIKHSKSSNNGSPYSIIDCNPGRSLSSFCLADLSGRAAIGGDDFYDVASFMPESFSRQRTRQVINTTTWEMTDKVTLKNILSYAELKTEQNMQLYGTNWQAPIFNDSFQPVGMQPIIFQHLGMAHDLPISDQKTMVYELQLQGLAMGDRLNWQAGLYYEKSEPKGDYGAQGPSTISCDTRTIRSPDPADWRCNNLLVALGALASGSLTVPPMAVGGSMARSPGGVTYENQAAYLQGTYQITDQWGATLGLRYTRDETEGEQAETVYAFPGDARGGYFPGVEASVITINPKASSEEPTWLIGLDYKPTADILLYAKYARGYRQGSVNVASVPGLAVHDPETVDTYEVGFKTSFEGSVPGTFNVSLFYNDFTDQQLQVGYLKTSGVGSTSIVNAGSSTIQGLEAEGTFLLTDNFTLSLSYAYLDTELEEFVLPFDSADPAELANLGIGTWSGSSAGVGEPLAYSPKNKLVMVGVYRLPVPESLGEMIASFTYSYTDEMQGVARQTSAYYLLDSYEQVDFNLNWSNIAGSRFDAGLFVTNAFDEEYINFLTGNWNSGLEAARVGTPRMYGARLRYNF